jgi:CRISPR/Cas system CMR-associated protein Cmr1 (group 7 of RAMP superfamily)
MSDGEFEERKVEQFGQKLINNEERLKERLKEIKLNFYNRLESKKLIKKQGRVPFTEHMTITNDSHLNVPSAL